MCRRLFLLFLFIHTALVGHTNANLNSDDTFEKEMNTSDSTDEISSFINNDYFTNPPTNEFKRPEEDLKKRINEMESFHGPFHNEISGELFELGEIYREQQNHELAYSTFKRSLEVNRMHHGLYDESQFAIVRQLILTKRDQQDWRGVNKYYKYLYWLHKRIFEPDTLEMLPILEGIIDWKIIAINKRLFGDPEALYEAVRNDVYKFNKIVENYPDAGRQFITLRISNNRVYKTFR